MSKTFKRSGFSVLHKSGGRTLQDRLGGKDRHKKGFILVVEPLIVVGDSSAYAV